MSEWLVPLVLCSARALSISARLTVSRAGVMVKLSTDGGVSGKLTMIMHIVVADASVVSFTITPALDTVSRAEMESALAEHNTNGTKMCIRDRQN